MGFPDETFAYLADLAANNRRDWFEVNRARYEAAWKAPGLDFIAEVSGRMAALQPPLQAVPKLNGSLRRINRDVRFSPDKSPYRAALHLVFWAGGHPNRSPAVHFVLTPEGVGYGAGLFGLSPAALTAVRARIVEPGDGARLIAALEAAETAGCSLGPPDLARMPKGFAAEGRRAELLRHKALVARTWGDGVPAAVMTGEGAAVWAMETTAALMPLVRWLVE